MESLTQGCAAAPLTLGYVLKRLRRKGTPPSRARAALKRPQYGGGSWKKKRRSHSAGFARNPRERRCLFG